ncbi:hypothetical protein F5884DRAFT_757712 [Xylogone sp. PMI_703]|nr:hypothetical protein F5884DRAFT_757712 [Xylogone sp. PMI_703]
MSARAKAFTKRNITAAWAACGLFPFNPDRVLKGIPKPLAELTIPKVDDIEAGRTPQDVRYYKSGTMLIFSTVATMYGGGLQSNEDNGYPGPIPKEGDGSYQIHLSHSGRVYKLYITH